MLVKLRRGFTWLWIIGAVLTNVAMIVGAFQTAADPWGQLGEWFNPLIFGN